VHAVSVQGNAALLHFFGTCDFSTTEAATYFHLDTFCTHAQCGSNRHFNGTFIVDTAFDLFGDSFSYDSGVDLGTTDLQDVDLYVFLTGQLFQLFLDAIHFVTAFTYDDTRFGGMNGNDKLTQGTLDHYAGDTTLVDTCVEVSSDLVIF